MIPGNELAVFIQDADEDRDGLTKVTVRVQRDSVTLGIAGCGVSGMVEGFDEVIYLERYEGGVRLLVWADINKEDPTHFIDLSDAMESNRRVNNTETTAPW